MSKQTYKVWITWHHRKWGPRSIETVSEGSSIRRALNKALLTFFTNKNHREERRDAHAALTVSVKRLKSATAALRKEKRRDRH